jgi:hypothetical protein
MTAPYRVGRDRWRMTAVAAGPAAVVRNQFRGVAAVVDTVVRVSLDRMGQGQRASATAMPQNAAPSPATILAATLSTAYARIRSSSSRTVSYPKVE